jgi:hypothetical protein
MAVKAPFPALIFSQLVGEVHISILGTILSCMSRSATQCTCQMRSITETLSPARVDTLGLDPKAAIRVTTINSIADGELPFF